MGGWLLFYPHYIYIFTGWQCYILFSSGCRCFLGWWSPTKKTWQFPEFRPSCGQRNKIHTQAVYMIQPTMLNNMCIHHTWHALYMIYVIYIYWNINYIILYYVILYYIKLYYIVLYCIILYCKILCYVILWCVLFCYVISYYIMLYYLMFEYVIWC